ncbi:hypothetical protein LSAT2_019082 [Lamellibrachia satsuma]|nr:hypothetical protein LSAT2_019082 [Lamellibrachia satsuma]
MDSRAPMDTRTSRDSAAVLSASSCAGVPLEVPAASLITERIFVAAVVYGPPNPNRVSSLWVGNVKPEVSGDKLLAMFSKHGDVASVRCLPDKFCAFINFKTKQSAEKAMAALQGTKQCTGTTVEQLCTGGVGIYIIR